MQLLDKFVLHNTNLKRKSSKRKCFIKLEIYILMLESVQKRY